VGTGLGQANGVQALDRSRQVIAFCGDGGFNMLMEIVFLSFSKASPAASLYAFSEDRLVNLKRSASMRH
jgi:hypothetical protein